MDDTEPAPLGQLLMEYYASKNHVTLRTERVPGKGSTVRASFPLPAALRERELRSMPFQVLLVDDHKIMRDGIKAILRHSDEFAVLGKPRAEPKPCRFARRSGRISF